MKKTKINNMIKVIYKSCIKKYNNELLQKIINGNEFNNKK